MMRSLWLIPTLLSFSRPSSRIVAFSCGRVFGGGRGARVLTCSSSTSTTFQNYRGGCTFLPGDSGKSLSLRSLKVSLSEDAAVSVNSNSPNDDKNNDDSRTTTTSYADALDINLPVETFGGLSYWNVENNKSFRVVFVLGGPGAGKGTQSAFLSENFPVIHLSAGDLLRAEQQKEDSPHRALIEEALVSGNIVPVEISLTLLRQAMQEKAEKEAGDQCVFLVDGFPRNEDNLSGWCQFMGHDPSSGKPAIADLWGVLVYQCPEKVLEERILERAKLSGRSDDNLESVRKRFKTFNDQTQPIIDELTAISKKLDDGKRAMWKVWNISGDQPLPDVTQNTQQMMNQLIRNDILWANQKLLRAIEENDVDTYQKLCDPLLLEQPNTQQNTHHHQHHDNDVSVMKKLEGKAAVGSPIGEITDARMEFISGKNVVVSYKRQMQGQTILESRAWVHKGTDGWQNVHFSRLASP